MSVSKARLTVYFEEPFWVGLYQWEDEDGCRVCKITFGGEPRDQEVLDYVQSHWRDLKFSPPVAGGCPRTGPSTPSGRGGRPGKPSSPPGQAPRPNRLFSSNGSR